MRKTLLVATLASVALAACGGSGTPNDSGQNTGQDAAGGNDVVHDGNDPVHDGGTGADSGDAGGTGPGTFACTMGTLFAGNPSYDSPMDRPAEGTPLLMDPPLPYRNVVFSNGQMITHDGQEIWRANLSDGLLHKVAGTESTQQALVTGACAGARFANIFGIALAHDGSLFVSDQTGNAILKITDPLGAGCTVSHYAGSPMDLAEGTFDPGHPPNVGNVEGAGSTARFALPERIAVDPSDNVYVWDAGNNSIRRIASDAAHTVSTIATDISVDNGGALSLAFLQGKLYVYGKTGPDTSQIAIVEIDPATMMRRDVVRGRADVFGGDSSDSMSWGGIVTDGTGLIVMFSGQLFYVETNGHVRTPALAGVYHPGLDYSSGYDPHMPHSAAMLEFPELSASSTAGAMSFLGIDANHNLFVSALGSDNYVERIACGP